MIRPNNLKCGGKKKRQTGGIEPCPDGLIYNPQTGQCEAQVPLNDTQYFQTGFTTDVWGNTNAIGYNPMNASYEQAQKAEQFIKFPQMRNNTTPQNTLQNLGITLRGLRTGIGEMANNIERGRQNKYDYFQQTALGMMNPMPATDYQPNPYSLYAKYGGSLKKYQQGGPVQEDPPKRKLNSWETRDTKGDIHTDVMRLPLLPETAYAEDKKWLQNWISSRGTQAQSLAKWASKKERSKHSGVMRWMGDTFNMWDSDAYENPTKSANKMIDVAQENIRKVKFVDPTNIDPNSYIPLVNGMYSPYDHKIYVSKFAGEGTPTHELSHSSRLENWKPTRDYIMDVLEKDNTYKTYKGENKYYYGSAGEIQSRIMGLRRSLNLKPDEFIDKKSFKSKLEQTYLPDTQSLFEFLSEDSIIDLLNNLVKKNDKNSNPLANYGGSLKKYQQGGRAPIIVNDKNDPRLRAYSDSLRLYNSNSDIPKEAKGLKKQIVYKDGQGYGLEKYAANGNVPIYLNHWSKNFDPSNLEEQTINIWKGNYKKPVQPVIYQEEKKLEKPSVIPRQKLNFQNGMRPTPDAPPDFKVAQFDNTKPTKYSFSYPTGKYNEQDTIYFPDAGTWKQFIGNQKLINSDEGKDYGTATGYLKYGGLQHHEYFGPPFSNGAKMNMGDEDKMDVQAVHHIMRRMLRGLKKGGLTPNKAREILHDGTANGHPLTEKQRRFFGAKSKGHTNFRGK